MNNPLRYLVCILAIWPACAQQQPDPIFKSKSELVLVPVVVSNNGQPVSGLDRKEFTLLLNGKRRSFEVFEEIQAVQNLPALEKQLPGTVQNFLRSNERQQDVVIVVLDFLNSSFNASNRIRHYLREMAQHLADSRTPVCVLILNKDGLVQVHSFSTDPQELTKAVQAWSDKNTLFSSAAQGPIYAVSQPATWSNPFDLTRDANAAEETLNHYAVLPGYVAAGRLSRGKLAAEITAKAFEQMGEMFQGFAGRKKMLWVSTGFPLSSPDRFDRERVVDDFQMADRVTRAWRAMSKANITIYTADSEGVGMGSSLDRTQNFMEITQKTGGTNCTDAISDCLKGALEDGNHYYLLGFYLHGDSKPGWNQLKVKLDRPAHQVRTREGFISEQPEILKKATIVQKAASDEDRLMTALLSPVDYTAVPLRLHWTRDASADRSTLVLVLNSPPGGIELDTDRVLNVDYLAVVRPVGESAGHQFPASLTTQLSAAQWQTFKASGFRYRKEIPLHPGRYAVRVLVRDNLTHKIGTISTVVDIPSLQASR